MSRQQILDGYRVLIVDDDEGSVSILSAILGAEGLKVAACTSGASALALAQAVPPQVAVLDLDMPEMSGLELLLRLRALQPGLPAVFVSGHAVNHPQLVDARALGHVATITKPIELNNLLGALSQLLARIAAA